MFKPALTPVSMMRLSLVVLERDERTVLHLLGRAGVVELTRAAAGPDTAPLSPRNRSDDVARLERLSSRLDNIRHSLDLPSLEPPAEPVEISLELAEKKIRLMEESCAGLVARRLQLQQQVEEMTTVNEQISDYQGLGLPLDPPDDSAFLHFVTGSLPARTLETLETNGATVLPLAERNGRQLVIALTTRPGRPALDRVLQTAGFQPGQLPKVAGMTVDTLADQTRLGRQQAADELEQVNAKLQSLTAEFSAPCARMQIGLNLERSLLEAGQNFPRTERSLLMTGWLPETDGPALERRIQEVTHGCCLIKQATAERLGTEEVPILLRQPWWLRPFAMLVTAYGLPNYRELEPTLFVAVSYLLMFGMMFGDVGHGFILALGGLALLLARRRVEWHDAGLLVLSGGCSSMIFGALYGSYFGLPQLKPYALWHDPLAGDPMGLMTAAVTIGIVMISLGLVLNIFNYFRRGDFLGGVLDKFGVAGAVFYWGALLLATRHAALRAHGLLIPVVFLLGAAVAGWMLKEPVQTWRERRAGRTAESAGVFAAIAESFVGAFEALLGYFANTISFVRLAAYAMSHAALLMAAFMIADDLKHLSLGAGPLSVLAVVLGNVVAIVLEGIVASVQALRLEYYEFFGKFFSGGGRPFQPFRLQATPVANAPP